MSILTTHVLDTSLGRPAHNLRIILSYRPFSDESSALDPWQHLANLHTDQDGRLKDLLNPESAKPGWYQLSFQVGEYFKSSGTPTFYGQIPIEFKIENIKQHYHVPLLLSPFGYSTYRGS